MLVIETPNEAVAALASRSGRKTPVETSGDHPVWPEPDRDVIPGEDA